MPVLEDGESEERSLLLCGSDASKARMSPGGFVNQSDMEAVRSDELDRHNFWCTHGSVKFFLLPA